MEYETKYGSIKLVPEESGFTLISTIPFKKVEQKFGTDNYNEAVKRFNKLKKDVAKIIEEMEATKKAITTDKSELYTKLKSCLKLGFKKLLLYGPTGTGKTYTAIQLLKQMKESGEIDDFITITFSSGMEDIDILGKFVPDSGRVIKFQPSELYEFLKANKDKKIAIIFDEFNRASSKTLNILIPMLDGRNGEVVINNFIKGETLTLPEDNVIFLFTANFGASYSGTFQLDEAILNRIQLSIFSDYQKDVEQLILEDLPEDKRKVLQDIINYLRDAYKQGLIHPFTTRDVKSAVILMQNVDLKASSIFDALKPLLDKLAKVDPQGYPDEEFLNEFHKFLEEILKK